MEHKVGIIDNFFSLVMQDLRPVTIMMGLFSTLCLCSFETYLKIQFMFNETR